MKKTLLSLVMLLMATAAAWADDVQLQDNLEDGTKYVNMPYTGTNTLTLSDASVMTFKVYDNGGAEGRYSNNSDGYLLITAPDGYALELTGIVKSETRYDFLTVYDGTTNEAQVLREHIWSTPTSSDSTDIGSIASTGRSLLLYFHSDNSSNGDGLNLNVTLFNPNDAFPININAATGGVMHSSKATSKYSEEITLTWTHETGYVLESITITDGYGRPLSFTGGSWYNAATHFIMPTSAATVTPTFVRATTSVDGLFINFPGTGQTKTCDIATGVTSFKVYDSGGADGEYPNNYDGYVVITAPEGLRLQLTGTITGEGNDHLTAYDGTTEEADMLLDHVGGTGHHRPARDIGIITTTGNSMMLYFHTDNSNTDPGLDLEVTLFDPNEAFPVNISSVTGGSMTSDKSTAKFTETIALTEAHENGYVLQDILVKDVNDRTVEVEGGTWYQVDASFTMPASRVTVTPTFIPATTIADGLFINMLKEGTITTNISTGVKSFKVYDNGGATGQYSDQCRSYLVLTVPEGYQMQVTGTIDAENCDYLTFYDGTDDQAPVLMANVSSKDSHNLSDIGIVTSSGRNMTIYFYSDGSQYDDGYDLNVFVFNPNEPQPITISPATGGAMASDVPSAKFNDVVTLTETHERGYTLESTSAVDANGTPVAINGGTWYNAAASFNMPIAGVTVTPTFTTGTTAEDGLFINMPKEGTLTTDICNGIKSFKVYDDGGAEGRYSHNCDGYLMLQAPIGYMLKVTGTVTSENRCDYLSIYDGTEVDEAKCLLKEFCSTSENNYKPIEIGEYGSTARTMLLYFRTDHSNDAAGLDLTVELIPITYTLAFDNGQAGATGTMAITGSMESITLTYDAPQNLPATGFSRTAYDFLGWSTAVDGEVAFADQAEVENLATEQGAEVTFYAKWQPITYAISYDLAGGTVPDGSLVAEYTVETPDFTLPTPTKLGYTFTGWEGTDLALKTMSVSITTGHWGSRSYNATWEPNPYKVRFNVNATTGIGGEMADQAYVYDSEQALRVNAFTRTGYTFKGWNTAADGSGTAYEDKQVVKNLAATRDAVVNLYAQWEANPYQVAFNANNGTGTMANQTFIYDKAQKLTKNAFTRKGYNFTGWNSKADGSGTAYADRKSVKNLTATRDAVVTMFAQWQIITYTISYDLASSTVPEGSLVGEYTVESPAITLPTPTRTGYNFDGWTGTDLTEPTTSVTIPAGSIGNRSYTANWTPIIYNIDYNLDGGSVPDGSLVREYTVENRAITLPTPTKAHWLFTGWTGTGLDAATQSVTIAQGSTGNRSYTANWERETYTVSITSDREDLISASKTRPKFEDDVVLTITDDEDYDLVSFKVNDVDVTSQIASGKYTISNVSANVSVVATYKVNKEFITLAHSHQTFSCSQDLDFTDTGLKAYIANGYSQKSGTVLLTRVERVPAGTGVIIAGEEGESYKIPYTTSVAYYTNLLKPVLTEQIVPETEGNYTNYLYDERGNQKGFFMSSGTDVVAAQQAYLQLPTSAVADVKSINIAFDDDDLATGIAALKPGMAAPEGVYDINGRKVPAGTILRTGVYVIRGHKVAIK